MKIKKTISLDFNGYYKEGANLTDTSGLYFVYRGIPTGEKKCKITGLLYIGQAEKINERVNENHEHYDDWKRELDQGEMLYYSVCHVEPELLDMVEAACIYKAQPCVNTQCKESYNYGPVRIVSSGRVTHLPLDFDLG